MTFKFSMFIVIGFLCMFEDLIFSKSMGLLDLVAWICFFLVILSELIVHYVIVIYSRVVLAYYLCHFVKCSFKNGGFFTAIKIWYASSSCFQSHPHFFVLVPTLHMNSLHSLLLRDIVLSIGSNHFSI
jgi:hypothetical protein